MSDVIAVASFFCDLAPQLGCWLAARQMHIVMLRAVMRAPLTFFDTTPIGRLISRFAKDVDVLDTSLPPQISDTIYCLFEVISFVACRLGVSFIIVFPCIFSTSQFEFHACTITFPLESLYTLDCDQIRFCYYNLCLLRGAWNNGGIGILLYIFLDGRNPRLYLRKLVFENTFVTQLNVPWSQPLSVSIIVSVLVERLQSMNYYYLAIL